jgi:hypothetical protein
LLAPKQALRFFGNPFELRTGFASASLALLTVICLVQLVYVAVTGVWPIVQIRSFMAVTTLCVSALRDAIDLETMVLAIGTRASLAAEAVLVAGVGGWTGDAQLILR